MDGATGAGYARKLGLSAKSQTVFPMIRMSSMQFEAAFEDVDVDEFFDKAAVRFSVAGARWR